MSEWLVDNASLIYLVVGFVSAALAAVWWNTRNGRILLWLVPLALLLGLVGFLSVVIETDSQRLELILHDMARGLRDRDLDRVFTHIAGSFDLANRSKVNRTGLRVLAESHMKRRDIRDISFARVKVEEVSRAQNKARVEFWVRGGGDIEGMPIRCEADFVLEDGAWKMRRFKLFIGNQTEQYVIP